MPSPNSRTPLSSESPRWVRGIDALCLALVVLSALVAMSGGFRIRLGPWRVAVTSPYSTLLWALALAIVRHVLAPATPVYRALPARLSAWWRQPSVHTAALVVAGTRPAILFVGYMAVLVIGYPPGPAPPMQVNNELVNLQARWDANWYLGIVTEGYHFVPNQPGLQQSIAFFPAYPMLVRGVGRILGGRLTSYIGAGMLVSFAAFFGALAYLYALARDTLDEDAARFALWALATYPFALFFGAIYVEPLMLLGMTATFYHFTHGRFGRAAVWGLLVGLTKTNGFLLSIPLALLAVSGQPGHVRRAEPSARAGEEGPRWNVLKAIAAAAMPGIGMLLYSAYVWQVAGDPLGWLKAHGAWGREYQGLVTLVGDRVNIIASAGVEGYVTSLPLDLINALGVCFVLAAVWPVARKLGVAYAVLILVFILPPLAAGGLVSAGRFSAVLFPAFIWLAAVVPPNHRPAWLASFAAFQALNAAMFYTWRQLY
jgi:Mannosyltransferase (PIG-V)